MTYEKVGRSIRNQLRLLPSMSVSTARSMPTKYRLAKKKYPTNIWLTVLSLGTKFTLVNSIVTGLLMKWALSKQKTSRESSVNPVARVALGVWCLGCIGWSRW